MNGAFLVYADNTVYQICAPTVESHCPNKGAILVPGSAHSSPGLGPPLPLARQFIGQSEAFLSSNARLAAGHSQKKCKFLSKQMCDAKYAVHPLLCLYIQLHVTVYALKK